MLLFEGEARSNAVFKAALKYHQPDTGYNRIKTKSLERASFRIIKHLRFAFN